ncbi:AIM24 family protein [Clostridium butyricum]
MNTVNSIKAESNAMITMSPTIDVTGNTEGGIFKGIARMAAGEKFFSNAYTNTKGGALEILFLLILYQEILYL